MGRAKFYADVEYRDITSEGLLRSSSFKIGSFRGLSGHIFACSIDAECRLIRDRATKQKKKKMFDGLAVHLYSLADQVELVMIDASKPAKHQ